MAPGESATVGLFFVRKGTRVCTFRFSASNTKDHERPILPMMDKSAANWQSPVRTV